MTRPLSRTILAMLALTVLVGACSMSAEQRAERDAERCAGGGHQPNTTAFADCLARHANERDARVQARHREMLEKSVAPPLSRGN